MRGLADDRGARLSMQGGSVLGDAEFDDGKGGRILIGLLSWPDGARTRSIAYLPPPGTDANAWRSLLTGKYGAAAGGAMDAASRDLHAQWCSRARCVGAFGIFTLAADVGLDGGQIVLSQPEDTADRLKALIEAEAARRVPRRTPAP